MTVYKIWSEKEIKMLKILYTIKGMDYINISKIINRTIGSIKLKIKRMKFRHSKEQIKNIKSKNILGENNPMYNKAAWSRGKNKNNSKSLSVMAIKNSIKRKQLVKQGLLPNYCGANNPMYGKPSWCSGLTKENDIRLKECGKKISVIKKQRYKDMTEVQKKRVKDNMAFIGSMCKKKNTSIEIKIKQYLIDNSINFEQNFVSNGFSFDFYLLKSNKVIECQGDYWHSNPKKYNRNSINDMQKKNIERDNRKINYLKINNIDCLFLWEYDIKYDFDNVKDKIDIFLKGGKNEYDRCVSNAV